MINDCTHENTDPGTTVSNIQSHACFIQRQPRDSSFSAAATCIVEFKAKAKEEKLCTFDKEGKGQEVNVMDILVSV